MPPAKAPRPIFVASTGSKSTKDVSQKGDEVSARPIEPPSKFVSPFLLLNRLLKWLESLATKSSVMLERYLQQDSGDDPIVVFRG
jgi:hypothetical protein